MINLIVNGNSYSYPQPGDKANTGWGSQATNWASAVTAALTALGLGGTLTPTPNTVIDINSTTKGILVPRLTTTQRNAITSPATSLLIFNTTLGVFQYYSGSAWITIGAKIPDNVQFDGTLTVNGNISTNGGVTAVGAVTGASLNTTGLATAATANFTDATDATNSTTAPVKTAGGLGIAKKLFVGTDANVGGNANITGKALTGDGTVSAPTYSFVNDPDSGLYRISENKIGFAANGARQGEFGVGYGGFTGNIIQVLSAVKSDTFTTNNTTYTDVPNLSISITPKYNNSKILLLIDIGGFTPISGGSSNMRLLRDNTEIYSGDGVNGVLNQVHDGGSTAGDHYYGAFHHGSSYLDSPNTLSTIIYKIQVKSNGSYSTVLNRSAHDSGAYNGRTASSITVLEVQQ